MIAKLDIKMCPFRKETDLVQAETRNQYMDIGSVYQESFLECIEENCMAWDSKARDCRLMMKAVVKEDKK